MPTVDAFTQSVEQALEQLDQPTVLGQRSPLAAPYFLGRHLNAGPNADTAEGRGAALGLLLRQATGSLSADQRDVLNVAYFEAKHHAALNEMRAAELHRSLRTYYRDRTAAVQALAAELGRLAVPPLRAELPRAQRMVGRVESLSAALASLQMGKSLAITGPSGSGKTTLGAHIAAQWPSRMHFWFTIRPGFSDNVSALLFGLCHWLRELGAASAWHQLIADAGKDKASLEFSRIRPMLRHDLEHIQRDTPDQPSRLFVCIDDVDLLDPQRAEHDRVLDIVRELRDLAPLLLIEQNLILATDVHVPLTGLASGDVAAMLRQDRQITLLPGEIERLAAATRGLPALVQLFMLLHGMGDTLDNTLRAIEGGLSADALFQHVWVRLSDADRRMLMQIAVYDGYAPADEWQNEWDDALRLAANGLLNVNESDGVAVTSYARQAVLRHILPSVRPALHLRAAEALERRGEYTAAARQYQQAHRPFQAIALWSEHRTEETERGQAEAALVMLRDIAPESLANDDERRILFTLRAELYRKLGAFANGLADLSSTTWPPSHSLTPYAETLRGDLHEFAGSTEAALASYESALQALAGQREAREVDIYRKIGFIRLYRTRNLEQASQAALQARFRAEGFHGKVLEERGNLVDAYDRFHSAAALLHQLENDTSAHALSEANLGRIAMTLGRFDEAISRIREAIRLYEQAGDLALHANQHMNLSYALNAAGRYEETLSAATERMQFVQDSGDTYLVSALTCNAAESCAHLGRLDEAEHYIGFALRQEEEFHRHYIITVQGIVHSKRQDYAQAEQHFTEAIRLAQESEDPFGEAPAWRWLALTCWQQGKQAEAKDAMARAHALFQTMGMLHELANIEKRIADWS